MPECSPITPQPDSAPGSVPEQGDERRLRPGDSSRRGIKQLACFNNDEALWQIRCGLFPVSHPVQNHSMLVTDLTNPHIDNFIT